MNIYFKILAIALLLTSGSFLSAEALTLDMEEFEEGQFTVETGSPDGFNVGDLLDVYEESFEVDGREYYSEYVDSLVVVEITEDSIILETLWYGAHVNLKTGYYLVPSSRSVETDHPELETLNAETDRAVKQGSRRNTFHLDYMGGIFFDTFNGLGLTTGLGFNFGYSYLSFSADATTSDFEASYFDLAYAYGFQITDWLQFTLGGGVASTPGALVTDTYMGYSYRDFVGLFLELGAKYTTRTIVDISLYGRGYLILDSNTDLNFSLFIGFRGHLKLLSF